jgi:colicin import membrane protein
MKRLLIALLLALPIVATAQDNSWEQPENVTVANPNAKYLAGAVPEVDGRVVFSTTIKAPGKSAKQIFDLLRKDFERLTKESNQFEQSRLTITDSVKGQVVGTYQEWLVFKNKPLNLDRTRLLYHLIADCRDGEADIQMTRIVYIYDEERNMMTYKAEEWINDRWGLNKKQTKLARVSGKFRRKTIDRKDYLFNRFAKLLEK